MGISFMWCVLFYSEGELLYWAFYVIFDAYRYGFFVGSAIRRILKGEDDFFVVEVSTVGFADDFMKVHPDEWDWKNFWTYFEETVFAIEILDEVCSDYGMEFFWPVFVGGVGAHYEEEVYVVFS